MPVRPRSARRALTVTATIAACVAAGAISSTSAVADEDARSSRRPKTVHVTGTLTLKDAKTGEYAAKGDLVGKWFIPPSKATDYYNTPTTIIQKGTESFNGCLVVGKERCGTLNSEYISWTYLRSDGRLISGGCTHAPTGGTASFKGVRGLLMMVDTPVGDDVNTVYQGEVILNAAPQEGSVPVPRASLTTAAAKTTAGTAVGFC